VAEWLRNGLQNRVHQFNSGRGLQLKPLNVPNILIPVLFRKNDLLPLALAALVAGSLQPRSTIASGSCVGTGGKQERKLRHAGRTKEASSASRYINALARLLRDCN
jgi:hypothetical protein